MTTSRFAPAPGSMEPLFLEPAPPRAIEPIADPMGYKLPDGDRPVSVAARAYHLGELVGSISGANSRTSFVEIAGTLRHRPALERRYGNDLGGVVEGAGSNALWLGGRAASSFVTAFYGTELHPRSAQLRETVGLAYVDFLDRYGQPGQADARRKFLRTVQRSARIIQANADSKKAA
ncbi:MAG TPA: hypothetical protein VLH84_05885 [Patescibacteria group bacterium]|nr:hypothetical protein [Patescibacteria group bacterium]